MNDAAQKAGETGATAAALPFRLVSGEPSPRFLGLTAAERNLRVAQRVRPLWVAGLVSDGGIDTRPA